MADRDAGLVNAIAEAVAPIVREAIAEALEKRAALAARRAVKSMRKVRVIALDAARDVAGLAHKRFDYLVRMLAAGVHVYMHGPAGSGKTHAAAQAAAALGRPFGSLSVNAQTTKTDMLGFRNVTDGRYHGTAFRRAFEAGGLFLLDEADRGTAILGVLNAALANGYVDFPDGRVEAGAGFVACAGGNTAGLGADRIYSSAEQLDAATLDRFAFLAWDYDTDLERALAERWLDAANAAAWAETCARARAEALAQDARIVIGPRAVENGARLLAAGFSRADAIAAVIYKGADEDLRKALAGAVR